MSDRYGAVRQMPCPDCGSPVQPDREQLCPRCGYPLMFLRPNGAGDTRAQSVPRSPNEHDDPTGLHPVMPPPAAIPPGGPGYAPAAGEVVCRACGHPNDQQRVRCERCGDEMRPARPQARVLAPPAPRATPQAGGRGWVIALVVLAVLALLTVVAAVAWRYLG